MENENEIQSEVLMCDCHSSEHQVIFNHFKDEDMVYVSIHLYKPSFWRRLRYLFGYKSRFGAWDEVLIPKNKFVAMVKSITQ